MIDGAQDWQYVDQQVASYVYEFDVVELFNIEKKEERGSVGTYTCRLSIGMLNSPIYIHGFGHRQGTATRCER